MVFFFSDNKILNDIFEQEISKFSHIKFKKDQCWNIWIDKWFKTITIEHLPDICSSTKDLTPYCRSFKQTFLHIIGPTKFDNTYNITRPNDRSQTQQIWLFKSYITNGIPTPSSTIPNNLTISNIFIKVTNHSIINQQRNNNTVMNRKNIYI